MTASLHTRNGQSATSPKHIILIDDDAIVRSSMTLLLRTKGYSINAYRSGLEYLQAPHRTANCLLVDYKMPRLNGLEFLEQLRAANDDTPAILITGYYSNTLSQRARIAGFSNILEKPLVLSDLLDILGANVRPCT